MRKRRSCSKEPTTFILKTYSILSDDTIREVVSWNEEGTAFVIHNISEFTDLVLPRYFKHNNFASFVRQLNMYDFHKEKELSAGHVFRHPKFLKGKQHMLKDIHRKTSEFYVDQVTKGPKTSCNQLAQRLIRIQSNQQSLELQLHQMEHQYRIILNQNQLLLSQLTQAIKRDRCRDGNQTLMINYLRSVQKGEKSHLPLPILTPLPSLMMPQLPVLPPMMIFEHSIKKDPQIEFNISESELNDINIEQMLHADQFESGILDEEQLEFLLERPT
jgi:heat shock transcription factor 1